ncbi:neogenin isoform X1 [Dermacentor silvarum]|uniref:neogenin isoform X1 n=1 Tax=Dermacentor silvarum TaxID=543639 RepID=UPI00189A6EDB|nr:neogenin isoform X1 [Dermacentor silvarum]
MAGQHRKQRGLRWFVLAVSYVLIGVSSTVKGVGVSFAEFRFLEEPSDTVVSKDGPALLNCSAAGDPKPAVSWKREGTLLHLINDPRRSILSNGSLHFRSVHHTRAERPDEGVYQCVATIPNVGTMLSRSAKLQVAALPRFDEQPRDLRLFPGQTAYFPCSAFALPPADVIWLKDQQSLQLDPARMLVLPSGALELDAVQTTDEGAYQCSAHNADRNRVSSAGNLFVSLSYDDANKISAPTFVAAPKSTVAVKGSNVTLDCAANGNPRPNLTWLKDGVTIDMSLLDSRFRKVGVGSLQIESIQEADEGTYMCRAENHEDSVDASAAVEVQVPPRFTKKPKNKVAYGKEDIEFECEVYGKPDPVVQWYHNGEAIIQSEYFQIVNGNSLRILGLVDADKGIYQCFGSNPAGNIQTAVQLIVLDPESPRPATHATFTTPLLETSGNLQRSKDVPSAPRDVTARLVSTRFATLSWSVPERVEGHILAYSVYYREEGSTRERVLNTTRQSLEEIIIQGLRPSTKYYFRVVAYNEHGPGESSPELEVETNPEVSIPGPPRSLKAIPVSPTAIRVYWEAPESRKEVVQHYQLSYQETGTTEDEEKRVTTTDTWYHLRNLKKYTEYNIWITAVNQNGSGISSEETLARTFSDAPSDIPQNVTLEAASSTSIIIRWEPPPKESQNGIITGYKIRYKLKGSRRGDTITTDGNRRLYALSGLEKGAQYSVKIAALSVNGTGPATDWMTVETYQNDLDESRVPDQPSGLRAKPTSTSIFVSWAPPRNQDIMIRGYTIGWGIGLPDVYTKVLNGKQRYYTIENLQPSNEYVISVRAFNQIGDGQPIYETVKTLIESTPEPLVPMLPPVGLKAIVLSPNTVVLFWSDSTLASSQVITDNRFYTVRYKGHGQPKYRYFNSTNLNCMIDDLRPNTLYEFAVKVVKGRRESAYSMDVLNTTQEAAPSSPPRDLTVVPSEDAATTVNLHWQPPKQQNGMITGYFILYTADNTQKDRDWVVETVVGDRMTAVIRGLTTDTTYHFKIQARNSKGYGPLSSEVVYHTGKSLELASGATINGGGISNNVLYIAIASGFTVILLILIVICYMMCRRRQGYIGPVNSKTYASAKGVAAKGGKGATKDLKPPDLWIHHDQMELKAMDKSSNPEAAMTATPISRNSQEISEEHIGTLDKKKNSGGGYMDQLSSDDSGKTDKPLLPRSSRTKPMMLPLDSRKSLPDSSKASMGPAAVSNGSMNAGLEGSSINMGRPIYPRTQYNIPRAHVTIDAMHPGHEGPSPQKAGLMGCGNPTYEPVLNPGMSHPSSSVMGTGQMPAYSNALVGPGGGPLLSLSSAPPLGPPPSGPPPSAVAETTGTLTKRVHAGNPLKSFSVPAPPPQSAPSTPQPKHMVVRPQQVTGSPHKKASVATSTSSGGPSSKQSPGRQSALKSRVVASPRSINRDASSSTSTAHTPKKEEDLASPFNNEELTQEMANLEGLMKDLNAITASEFEC